LEKTIAKTHVEPHACQALLGTAGKVMLAALGIALVGSALCMPSLGNRPDPVVRTRWYTESAAGALEDFRRDVGRYPTTAEGLRALTERPPGIESWKGPYGLGVRNEDAWGRGIIYRCPGRSDPAGYDLISPGPDGKEGTKDDVIGGR
jgi:general secretion pathway protein G